MIIAVLNITLVRNQNIVFNGNTYCAIYDCSSTNENIVSDVNPADFGFLGSLLRHSG